MSEKFNFKGELNGVEYDSPEKFIEDLKKATTEGSVKSVSYQYSSVSGKEPKNVCGCNANNTTQCIDDKCTKPNKDTVERVSLIKEIIEDVAGISDTISETEEFGQNKLTSVRDMIGSSLDKIKYIISGMRVEDRKDFCDKFLGGIRHLHDVADSEYKDLIYEEAKYRRMISEENDDIEKEIADLEKSIDSLMKDKADNDLEIVWSKNRCSASEVLRDFFGDLIEVLEIK